MIRNKILLVLAGCALAIGLVLRFYRIAQSDFIFYDEGYYLNWNRPLGEILARHQLSGIEEFSKAVFAYASRCLASGKALWFMLVDLRIFGGGLDQWYVSRLLAAILGALTLALTFVFSKRFFGSLPIALFSTSLLAVLPSHVFYSRIGLQESLSTLLVLAGFYFYLFPQKFGWRTLAGGLCFGAAYFSNYRLIMLPLLITFAEIFFAVSQKRWPDLRKWLWVILAFFSCVFFVGNFNGGQNTTVIFSWIFHQAHMAQAQFSWCNLFSYPYYVFRLETFLFAVFFFLSFYFVIKNGLNFFFPFFLVLLQMAVFTFASEKGARYVGVVLPFMAMAVAFVITQFWTSTYDRVFRAVLGGLVLVMVFMMTQKSFFLANSRSDYRLSAGFIHDLDPQAKFFSSQNYVQNLYRTKSDDVRPVPESLELLVRDYQRGYRYLVLCPQAYISLTESKKRFEPHLRGYLGFLTLRFKPREVFLNFSPDLLERFVFEHNENLWRSVKFLENAGPRGFGAIKVYDLSEILPTLLRVTASAQGKGL